MAVGTQKGASDIAGDIAWLPKGPKSELTLGNNVHVDYDYDTSYRLQKIESSLLSLRYGYDASGNITSITDANHAELTKTYTYEENNRLKHENSANGDITYEYDLDGNRSGITKGIDAQTQAPAQVTTYTYDRGQVLTLLTENGDAQEIQRDAYGNLTTGRHNGKVVTREYNIFNQLIHSTRDGIATQYGYTAHRQRAWKKTGSDLSVFIYDVGSEKLLAEYKNGKLEKEYIYFDSQLVAIHSDTDNKVFFVQNDHLGRPQIVSDENQNIVWQADNQSFDRDVIKNEIGDLNIGFPGQYYDRESGLYYNINRDYDPAVGRYVQSDPIGFDGGLNTYTYVENSPISYIDPFGLDVRLQNTGAIGGWHQRVAVDDNSPDRFMGISFGTITENNGSSGASGDKPDKSKEGYGEVYRDQQKATSTSKVLKTTKTQDWRIKNFLSAQLGKTAKYHPLTNSCRHYSKNLFEDISNRLKIGYFGK